MTGTLQTKKLKGGEYYYVVLYLYEDGKRKPKWIPTGLPIKGNKKRADALLRDALNEHERKHETQALPQINVRFSDWVRQWLKESRARVDEITWQGYSVNAETHILPYFDDLGVPLANVSRPILQTYIDFKAVNGRKDGKGGLAPKSIQHLRSIMQQALKAAVLREMIPANPCEGLVLPKRVRYEYKFYNEEQLMQMFHALRDERIYPMVRIASVYGLRRSELLGLQWDSVDFHGNMITIRHTVVKVKTTVAKDKTKSKSSYRSFPLVPDVRELLLQLKAAEDDNRRLFGKEYEESPYIFKWDNGKSYATDYVSHRFNDLLLQKGLPHIRFHDLRHSCASLLIAQGFSLKDVQEWLGHADITLTANTYAHLDMSRKKNIANSLVGALSTPG
jgi:integrase